MTVILSIFIVLNQFKFDHYFQLLMLFPLFLSPPLLGRIWYNFCPDIFAFPAWTAMSIALAQGKSKGRIFWIGCLIWSGMCKETFWLTGAIISITASIMNPSQRKFFYLLTLLQLTIFIYLFFIWMPTNSNLPAYYGLSYFVGPELIGGTSFLNFIHAVISNIFSLKSLTILAIALLASGVIHPKAIHLSMLPATPGMLMIIGSLSPQIHSPLNQYLLPVMPFLTIGAMSRAAKLDEYYGKISPATKYLLVSPALFLSIYYPLKVYPEIDFSFTRFFHDDIPHAYENYIKKDDLLVIDGTMQPLLPHHMQTVTLLSFWGNPRKLSYKEVLGGFKVITGEKIHELPSCEQIKIGLDKLMFDYQYFSNLCKLIKTNGVVLTEYPRSNLIVYHVPKQSKN